MTRAHWFTELLVFAWLQARACLFGALLLLALILTRLIWQADWTLHRYDALFLYALTLQALMLILRLETWEEAKVIALFHLTGTGMELFKTAAGSWTYPEPALFRILDVPLFSGFMYASVGSYIARVIRLCDMQFDNYPPLWTTLVLATAIYGNFFAHHFGPDLRNLLFLATLALFTTTNIRFTVVRRLSMPLPLAAFLASLFLWLAENVGTITGTWIYAGQSRHDWAPLSKMGSWYLLLYVSFVTVTIVVRRPLLFKADRASSTPKETARSRPAS